MLTEKDYCDYETCVALKELGYVGSRQECECFGAYFNFGKDIFTDSLDNTEVGTNEYLRVSLYLAQKWLREKHNLHIEVRWYSNLWYEYEVKEAEGKILAEGSAFKTYEEALSTAVYMATEYLKEK
jgi:hypothetical protein